MTTTTSQTTQILYPALRYADAHAAIDWLCKAFGFVKQEVYDGPNGTVAHAQLTLDGAVLMLGSARDDAYPIKTPNQLGGNTGSIYVYVPDPDAHFERARGGRTDRYGALRYGVRLPRIRRIRCRGPQVEFRHVSPVDDLFRPSARQHDNNDVMCFRGARFGLARW
jgi:hypothetical protein